MLCLIADLQEAMPSESERMYLTETVAQRKTMSALGAIIKKYGGWLISAIAALWAASYGIGKALSWIATNAVALGSFKW